MLFFAATVFAAPPVADRVSETQELRAKRLSSGAPTIPAEVYAGLKVGHVETGLEDVPGSKARKAWGVGVVDVPIAKLFAAINDDVNKVAISKLSHNVVLEGEPCGAHRVNFQYLPVPLLTDRWWVVELKMNGSIRTESDGRVREMAWTMVPDGVSKLGPAEKVVADGGMSVAATEGGWLLIDLDGAHTLIEFWSFADPGGNIPVRMAQSFASGGISDSILAMAAHGKAGPACTL